MNIDICIQCIYLFKMCVVKIMKPSKNNVPKIMNDLTIAKYLNNKYLYMYY